MAIQLLNAVTAYKSETANTIDKTLKQDESTKSPVETANAGYSNDATPIGARISGVSQKLQPVTPHG